LEEELKANIDKENKGEKSTMHITLMGDVSRIYFDVLWKRLGYMDIWIEKVPVPITRKGGSRGWPSQGLEHEIKSIRKYIII